MIPTGFSAFTPAVSVQDMQASIDFYTRAFGFTLRSSMPGPDGKLMHAELTFRDSTLMLGPVCNDARTPRDLGASPTAIYVYVDDVDAVHGTAMASGAKEIEPLKDMFWGDRTSVLEDPDGYRWWFATHVKDTTTEEMQAAITEMAAAHATH